MALVTTSAIGKNPSDLQNAINAILLPLTTISLRSVSIFNSSVPRRTIDFQGTVTYDTGGPTLTQPYQVALYAGGTLAIATALAQAAITANPTYWFGPMIPMFVGDSERYTNDYVIAVIYNTDYTSGVIGYNGPAGIGNDPEWVSATISYTQLQTAALTNTLTIYSLPAKGCIQAVKQKHSTAFTGGAIATCTSQIGISGTIAKYAAAFDIFQAPGDTAAKKQITGNIGIESDTGATPIILTATSTVANLGALTQGSLVVSLLISIAP
jgi:hypothetical protein